MTTKRSILIPDGESNLLMHVVHCLSQNKVFDIHVLSSHDKSVMQYSRFISSFTSLPQKQDSAQWIKMVVTLVRELNIDVLMPVTERGIREVINSNLPQTLSSIIVPIPSLQSFDRARNKWELHKLLTNIGVPSPQSVLFNSLHDLGPISFPLVVKPTLGLGGGSGIGIVKDLAGLQAFFEVNKMDNSEYILQEYISGIDYTCSVLCSKGEIIHYTIQRSDTSNSEEFGPQMSYTFEHNERIFKMAARLFQSLEWSGIASLDIRYDIETDTYKVLEVNTRFWRSLVGSMYAGVNFPAHLAYMVYYHELQKGKGYKNIQFFDLQGYFHYIAKNPLRIFNLYTLFKKTYLLRIVKDPAPYLLSVFRKH